MSFIFPVAVLVRLLEDLCGGTICRLGSGREFAAASLALDHRPCNGKEDKSYHQNVRKDACMFAGLTGQIR